MQDIWSKSEYRMNIEGPNTRVEKIKTSIMAISDEQYWALGGKTGSLGELYNIILFIKLSNGLKAIVVTARSSSSNGRAFDCQVIYNHCNKLSASII